MTTMKACFAFLLLLAVTRSAFADECLPGGGGVADCGGVHVVRLRGSPVERARRMGELIRSGALSGDVLAYFAAKVTAQAAPASPLAALFTLAYNQLVRLFHRGAPAPLAEEVDAMARA